MISESLAITISQEASVALLRIARNYQSQGLLHQALTPYLKIVAYYPDSEAAPAAVEGVVAIAKAFEERQQLYIATGVYDRLEEAARFQRWDGHALTEDGDII